MRVIVTRPREECAAWVAELSAHGWDAQALPLIEIASLQAQAPLHRAWAHIDAFAAVMFVSGAAVRGFMAARPPGASAVPWPRHVRAWVPGPGTQRALLQSGVPEDTIDSPGADARQFDSEALWAQVSTQVVPGRHVLIVRGSGEDGAPAGRDWLAAQAAAAGATVEAVAAYRRCPPAWTAAERTLAQQSVGPGSAWVFSSSEAIGHLGRLLPGQDWSAGRAVATHERVVQAAQALGFGVVRASRPTVPAVVASLQSLG